MDCRVEPGNDERPDWYQPLVTTGGAAIGGGALPLPLPIPAHPQMLSNPTIAAITSTSFFMNHHSNK
jgi:hypothetical protein